MAHSPPTRLITKRRLIDFDSHQEKRLYSLRTQLGQQQDDMISKVNLLWKTVSEKLDDTPLCDTAGSPTVQMNFTSTDYHTKEELRSKGIKSPSKLLSPKYLSQSSVIEQNKNPSSPKCVHFVNSIVILNKENETEEESSVKPSKTEYTNRKEVDDTDEEVESKKEVELEPRRKPSKPKKNYNFVGRVKGLKVFIGDFTYECDFMVLEDTTRVIDHYLGSVVFGKPFVEATRLVYNKEEGTIVFERDKEKTMFKMPHKIDMFKHIDFADISIDRIPPFIVESDDDNCEKTHYSDSLDLGPELKYDEYVCRGIRSLMAAKARRKNKGGVT
ncbi:hypothetical protein Tco_0401177 [Tanacetum coccineum]